MRSDENIGLFKSAMHRLCSDTLWAQVPGLLDEGCVAGDADRSCPHAQTNKWNNHETSIELCLGHGFMGRSRLRSFPKPIVHAKRGRFRPSADRILERRGKHLDVFRE